MNKKLLLALLATGLITTATVNVYADDHEK
jgi:hypothetical protein